MTTTYDLRVHRTTAVVRLAGRIDRDAIGLLDDAYAAVREAADGAGGPGVVLLDFTDVDYVNSTGIALIVGLLGKARADGRRVQAAGLTPHYQHIFEITRLSDVIEIV
jgi:anti-anti-sigma factor